LKTRIVSVWEQSTNEGVRIACIKFIEKVIATQTPGIKDPRVLPNDFTLRLAALANS